MRCGVGIIHTHFHDNKCTPRGIPIIIGNIFKASSLRVKTPNNADKKNTRVHERTDYDRVNILPANTMYINTDSNINDCNY